MSKTYLGTLCKRNHNYQGTGKSLRYSSNDSCVECLHLLKVSGKYKDKSSEYNKEYYLNNKEKILESNRIYMEENKDKVSGYKKKYRVEKNDRVKETQKRYRESNKDKIRIGQRKYRMNNMDKVRQASKEYSKKNRDSLLKKRRKYYHNILKNDINFKINNSIRSGINSTLSGRKNCRHWETLVGYTLPQLKKHLEKQFTDGMTWDNYGKWHIDHIVPSSLFEFESHNDLAFKECWNLHNLQPLWAEDNLKKSNRFIG